MPTFSQKSEDALSRMHPKLAGVLRKAILEMDFTIMDSTRGRAAQERAFSQGNSKAHFGDSAHNYEPSIAADVAPWPIDWNDRKRFETLAKIILRIAKEDGVPLRWGGDWNMDGSTADGWDFPHFELHPWRQWAKESKLVKD